MLRNLRMSVMALSFAIAWSTSARADWTITTSDLEAFTSPTLELDAQGARVASEGTERRLGWEQFLSAERVAAMPTGRPAAPAATTQSGQMTLHLIGGDTIVGAPVGLEDEKLRWSHPLAGEVSFPVRRIARMTKESAGPRPDQGEQALVDEVLLANGDLLAGIITGMGATELVIHPTGLDPVPVPFDSITSVRFASTGQQQPGATAMRAFRVRLSDGTAITVPFVTLNDASATLTFEDDATAIATKLDPARVVGVEQVNGPVAWLSVLPPVESQHVPFLGSSDPARIDRTVTGDPIRFEDKMYARGIGVHSRSTMTWDIPDGYTRFRTRYAIDGDLPYANVTVRIKLDDHVVHEQPDVTAGELSPVIEVPLNDARRLTLEVDYGQTYDVQDRMNWIEPALLK